MSPGIAVAYVFSPLLTANASSKGLISWNYLIWQIAEIESRIFYMWTVCFMLACGPFHINLPCNLFIPLGHDSPCICYYSNHANLAVKKKYKLGLSDFY